MSRKVDGGEMFKAVCELGLEGIASKKLDAPYKSEAVEVVAENQKSEPSKCPTRGRKRLMLTQPQ